VISELAEWRSGCIAWCRGLQGKDEPAEGRTKELAGRRLSRFDAICMMLACGPSFLNALVITSEGNLFTHPQLHRTCGHTLSCRRGFEDEGAGSEVE